MKRILLTAAASAAALLGSAAAAAPALAATPQPVSVHLATDCPSTKPADFGRGVRLGPTVSGVPQITLSTKSQLVMNWNVIKDPTQTGSYETFTLSHGKRYLRVNATHAWLGTKPQVFSVTDGYGDGGCGGPRPIHIGLPTPGRNVWTARGKVLISAPESSSPDRNLAQTWNWVNH
jgi:hypothetical protein